MRLSRVRKTLKENRIDLVHPAPSQPRGAGRVEYRALQAAAPGRELLRPSRDDWRRVAMRYDRCPGIFRSAYLLAAIVMFWS